MSPLLLESPPTTTSTQRTHPSFSFNPSFCRTLSWSSSKSSNWQLALARSPKKSAHPPHPSKSNTLVCKQTSQQDLVTTCVTDCFAIYNQKQNKETTQKYRVIWNPDFLWRSMRSWPSWWKEINAIKFPQNIYWKESSNVCCREWKENPTGFTLASQETWAQAVSNGRCRS